MLKLTESNANRELVRLFPHLFSFAKGTRVVTNERPEPGFSVLRDRQGYRIEHGSLSALHRALAEIVRQPELEELAETPRFEFRGLMVDASRGGVPHAEHVKRMIGYAALLGFSHLALYTEDTYVVAGQPLFGYLRGAYSQAELAELSAYGALLGVELFPCIQTLAHLEQVLQYADYTPIKDTRSVLAVGAKGTRAFVESLLESATAPYASRWVHVGMDEPWDLGRGRCFEVGKPIDPRELYLAQLELVSDACEKRARKMMYWGDVVVGQHGDPALNAAQTARLPQNAEVVFWDYYHEDEAFYEQRLREYRAMGYEPFVAPGVWNWDRLWGLYEKCKRTTGPMLRVAKRQKISRVLMTMWGDDGQECPWRSNLPALCYYAEHCFRDDVNDSDVDHMLQALCGDPLAAFVLPSALDCPTDEAFSLVGNRSKGFLWDDPLLRLYLGHFSERKKLCKDYAKLAKRLSNARKAASAENAKLFRYAADLARALADKIELLTEIERSLRRGERKAASKLARRVQTLMTRYSELWQSHRSLWLEENKPFGLEVIDGRYGGALARLGVLRQVLRDFGRGKLESIDEFATTPRRFLGENPVRARHWRGLATPAYPTWA